MIIRNGIKYACAPCIKGHRVASCNHTDRPLEEIKRKGRPSTACFHCKELRMVRNVNPSGSCQCRKDNALNSCGCTNGEPCKCHTRRKRGKTSNKGDSPIPTDISLTNNIDDELSSLFQKPLSELLDIPDDMSSKTYSEIHSSSIPFEYDEFLSRDKMEADNNVVFSSSLANSENSNNLDIDIIKQEPKLFENIENINYNPPFVNDPQLDYDLLQPELTLQQKYLSGESRKS